MSISPVLAVATATQIGANKVQTEQASAAKSAEPDPGSRPIQEGQSLSTAAVSAEPPEDEVKVQRDSQTNDEVVIRYMDGRGNLVLQVPSSQVLDVSRGIDEELERIAKARGGTAPSALSGQGGHNGD